MGNQYCQHPSTSTYNMSTEIASGQLKNCPVDNTSTRDKYAGSLSLKSLLNTDQIAFLWDFHFFITIRSENDNF